MSPYTEFELWLMSRGFKERDIKEIRFAILYKDEFGHGTDGHNRLMIVANLARNLELMFELTREKQGT